MYGPCTRPSTHACTRPCRVHGYGHGPCTQPSVYTACTRPCTYGCVHGPCTAVFTARTRPGPCTRVACVLGRVHGTRTRSSNGCAGLCTGRVHVYTTVYTVVYTCTRPVHGHGHGPCAPYNRAVSVECAGRYASCRRAKFFDESR